MVLRINIIIAININIKIISLIIFIILINDIIINKETLKVIIKVILKATLKDIATPMVEKDMAFNKVTWKVTSKVPYITTLIVIKDS